MDLFDWWSRLRNLFAQTPVHSDEGFVAGGNAFAFALYAHLREAPGNRFVSPLSIRTALAMAMAGARGATEQQMQQVLQLPATDDAMHALISRNIQRLKACSTAGNELTVANSLWHRKAFALAKPYIKTLNRHYAGQFHAVDFTQAVQAADRMNAWIEDLTNHRIKDLMSPERLKESTQLVILNAVYFAGTWKAPFQTSNTVTGSFKLDTQTEVQVAFMSREDKFRIMRGNGFQMLELKYAGEQLSMLILLPDAIDGLPALEDLMSAELLQDCCAQLKTYTRYVSLPKFTLSCDVGSLVKPLRAMGMELPFGSGFADFSGMNRSDGLYISEVRHKTYLAVNERGTEAAAATSVEVEYFGASSQQVTKKFVVDHPFMVIIQERATGLVLFMGRVSDPSREQ